MDRWSSRRLLLLAAIPPNSVEILLQHSIMHHAQFACLQDICYALLVALQRPFSNPSISAASRALSSNPTAVLLLSTHAGTDRQTGGRTDTVPFHIDPDLQTAYREGNVNNKNHVAS